MVYRAYSYDKKAKQDKYTDINLGRPVWECFPDSPDNSNSITNATQTYIGRLVPISRWVRLIENTDKMYCCNGFKYSTYRDGFPAEPTAAVHIIKMKDKKGTEIVERRIVGINPSKATWRELSALLTKRASDGLGGPLAMENSPDDSEFDFQVCAMTRDQASMDIGIESVFHISPAFQSNISVYSAEVEQAEKISRRLRWAVEAYRSCINSDWNSRVKRTQARDQTKLRNRLAQVSFLSFWTAVEKNLSLLMAHIDALGTDAAIPSRESWRKMLFASACEAYRTSCGQGTPRQIRAFAKGWQKLTVIKVDNEPYTNDRKEEEI